MENNQTEILEQSLENLSKILELCIGTAAARSEMHNIRLRIEHHILGTMPSVHDIIEIVANYYGISTEIIKSHQRKSQYIRPRHVAIYLSCVLSKRSTVYIGNIFNKDHSSIMSARDKIKKQIEDDGHLNTVIMKLTELCLQNSGNSLKIENMKPVEKVTIPSDNENDKPLPMPRYSDGNPAKNRMREELIMRNVSY